MPISGNETVVRAAYRALVAGDVDGLLEHVSEDVAWTYLDPAFQDPEPQTCHGRGQLRRGLRRQLDQGLTTELEEVAANGDRVLVVVHVPGLDQIRVRQADDRLYEMVTVRDGRIVALQACHDRDEALVLAGISGSGPVIGGRRV
jgi:ketosteroid isomerase-like protein